MYFLIVKNSILKDSITKTFGNDGKTCIKHLMKYSNAVLF